MPRHFWDRILYNQTADQLKNALVGRPETVVADVPYGSEHRHAGISFRGLWRRNDAEARFGDEHEQVEDGRSRPEEERSESEDDASR